MSVTEADVMTLMGETQEATVGGRQADISAAIERQALYEAAERAEFGTAQNLGPQFLAQAVPLVTGTAFGMLSAFSFGGGGGIQTQLSQLDQSGRQIGPAEQIPRMGEPTPPRTNFPVPIPEPGAPVPPGIGMIGGAIIGAIGAILFPSPTGDSDFGRSEQARHEGAEHPLPTPPEDIIFGPVPESGVGPPAPTIPQVGLPPYEPPAAPAAPKEYGVYDIPGGPRRGDTGPYVYPQAGPENGWPPAPTPAPAPASSPAAAQRRLPEWAWGLIGLGAIQLARSSRRSSSTVPFVDTLLTPFNPSVLPSPADPLTQPTLEERASTSNVFNTSTFFGSSGSGAWGGNDDTCQCRKPGKKRKCLARAQLSWRSGPKKGKAAGMRCYRFAN